MEVFQVRVQIEAIKGEGATDWAVYSRCLLHFAAANVAAYSSLLWQPRALSLLPHTAK